MNDDTLSLFDSDTDARGPFARYAVTFVGKGYAVTTLPAGGKWPPRTGTTGKYPPGGAPNGLAVHEGPKGTRHDLTVDEVQRLANSDEGRHAGLGVVLVPGVVVFDIDDGYTNDRGEVQRGASALAAFVAEVGVELPDAPSMRAEGRPSSSRRVFFRCPDDVVFVGQVCDDVEILQATHRYSVGPGTVHPDAGVVRCYDSVGREVAPDEFPAVHELPLLPDEYVQRLAKGRRRQPTLADAATDTTPKSSPAGELGQWRKAHDADSVTVPPEVWKVHLVELPFRYRAARDKQGNKVDGNNSALWWTLCRVAEEVTAGLYPADEALDVVRELYLHEASGNRPDDTLVAEYERRLPDAVAYALHDTDGRARVAGLQADPERFHDDALQRQGRRDADAQLDELHEASLRSRQGLDDADELRPRRIAKAAGAEDDFVDTPPRPVTRLAERTAPPQLPDEFYEARPALAHIRRAALSTRCAPDAVLHAVLVRLSAMTPHRYRVQLNDDAGSIGLGLYGIVVGPKGVGKTKAVTTAERLLPTPPDSTVDFADSLPLGSGEGIVESYFGQRPVLDEHGNDTGKTTREQVRNNVLMRVDEGTKLLRLQERSGSTVGDTIVAAFLGNAPIGERNASSERTRVVPAGQYVLGLAVCLQTNLSGPLFAGENESNGAPERFLWASANDTRMPDERPSWPGELVVRMPVLPEGERTVLQLDDSDFRQVVARMPKSFADAVDEAERAKHRNYSLRTDADDTGNHEVVVVMKVATLFALLDSRVQPNEDDVRLAEQLVGVSQRVAGHCRRVVRQLDEAEAERRVQASERKAERVSRAVRRDEGREALDTAVGQYARKVRRLHDEGVVVTRREALRSVKGKLLQLVSRDDVHDTAVARKYVVVDDDGNLQPGPKSPPAQG